jgi:hypothetical protein
MVGKKLKTEYDELLDDINQYQILVEKLIYVTVTRLDLAFNVSQVSQFMHATRKTHMEAIDKNLRFLKGTPRKGILMKKYNTNIVCGYTNADWTNSFDRKSTIGYCTFVHGNIVI